MKLSIPELSLVLLVGPSGCGKSTFARRHFRPTEVLSSDYFRGLVCDDESSQSASRAAFDLLHQVLATRLRWRRFTVLDATNLQADGRKTVLELARQYHYLTTAIVFDLEESVCQSNNDKRPDRTIPARVITGHVHSMRRVIAALESERIKAIHILRSSEEVDAVTIERRPLWSDRRDDHGPFDIIGDVHGCYAELLDLLDRLGYQIVHQPDENGLPSLTATPPSGRKAIFVGDLGDRGPNTPAVYRLVMNMVSAGTARCVLGNHDDKLLRHLRGNKVKISHGFAETVAQLETENQDFRDRIRDFLAYRVAHYELDGGRLVVAHAGLKQEFIGRASGTVRSFALYGDTTGETDELGLPVRRDWALEYRGPALVVYGHTPVAHPARVNNTINIDTGCVFGGRLSALRYPERDIVSVQARQKYCEPARPFLDVTDGKSVQQRVDDVLDIGDVSGRRTIATRLMGNIVIPAERAEAALEVMSRFAANPKWLIYLPPTMSPCETSRRDDALEHPVEAFAHYRGQGLAEVICQEKHMGSRAVVIVCRDEAATHRVFGVEGEGVGIVLTRTGRKFFEGPLHEELLAALRSALTECRFWERHSTDWVCLDAELMPWSAKAQELLRTQYAATGAAARAALAESTRVLAQAEASNPDVVPLAERMRRRSENAERFVAAYRRYCWSVDSLAELRLAPFHLLATEGSVHVDRPHGWHLEQLRPIVEVAPGLVQSTRSCVVNVADDASIERGVVWWEEITSAGGEGMVVKPADFVARGERGILQPAVKCRGRDYLRIIYGPDYLEPENLTRLRRRGLSGKRGLALREFALGVEGLERFVRRDSLRSVHECAFAVLALESEPIDPRL
jgi:protein phosphatase